MAALVCTIAVGLPVLLGLVSPSIPMVWWVVVFAIFLAALVYANATDAVRRRNLVVFSLAVAASWVVVVTVPGMGFIQILLVITAAASIYIMPLWASAVLIVLNTTVTAVQALLQSVPAAEGLTVLGFYLLIQFATVLSTATMLRERRLRQELTEAHIDLRAASVLLSESSRNAERLRISRDLHDLIGHQLTVLTLELEAARHRPGERAVEHVDRADGVARDLLADVRATVGELRSGTSDLAAVLHGVVRDLPDLDITLVVEPDVHVDDHQQAALVRSVQEIVTNTLRHALANRLWISVSVEGDRTVLRAVDDGMGHRAPTWGNGLHGLRERFEELDGDVTVDGADGFRVTARMVTARTVTARMPAP